MVKFTVVDCCCHFGTLHFSTFSKLYVCWDLAGIWLGKEKLLWFGRFPVEDKTTGIDLFKLHVKWVTMYYDITDLRSGVGGI